MDTRGPALKSVGGALVLLVTGVLAAVVVYTQMANTLMLREPRVRLERYLSGDAAKPFAFRLLVPAIVRAGVAVGQQIEAVVPSINLETVGQSICSRLAAHQIIVPGVNRCLPYVVLAAVLWLSLIAFCIGIFLVYRVLHPDSAAYSVTVPAFALLCVCAIQSFRLGLLYDFTVLAIMTWGLYLILTGRRVLFFVVFAIGCANKETTALLIVAYAAAAYGVRPIRAIVQDVFLLTGISAAIYFALQRLFASNAGAAVEHWWAEQIPWMLSWGPIQWSYLVVILGSLRFGWLTQPLFVRRASLMFYPFLALCFIGAHPGEVRNIYEVLPLLILIWARNIALGWSILPKNYAKA